MQQIRDAFDSGHVILGLEADGIPAAIEAAVERMAVAGILSADAAPWIAQALRDLEQESPTTIGNATAVPHAGVEGIERQTVLFVRLARPINTDAASFRSKCATPSNVSRLSVLAHPARSPP